jgi:hypothetical protein
MDQSLAVEVAPVRESRRALCADVSSAGAESLAATASRIDHWILVEYRGLWGRDVLGDSLLSAELKRHLRDQLARLPHSRLLFVKKPERRPEPRRTVFFGCSRQGEERFYRLEFDRHEDLLSLDFVAALRDSGVPGVPVDHPLFVVCTHGKRDRCCAKYGNQLYDRLCAETEPTSVWQATHVGGDRFAGNVVCLPEGLYFGRVGDDDVAPLLASYFEREINLERYRGRSGHTFAVQAAERFVRDATGLTGIDAVVLAGVRARDEGWTVELRTEEAVHEVDVLTELSDEPVYLTCAAVTPQHARRFVATGRRVRPR